MTVSTNQRATGVPICDQAAIFIPLPTGGDDTGMIQALINQASTIGTNYPVGEYVRVVAQDQATYSISGLEFKSNVWFDANNAVFVKNAVSNGSLSNSMFRTIDALNGGSYYGNYNNIKFTGGVWQTNNNACSAQIIRFENVQDGVIENVTVQHSASAANWAFQIGGKRIRIINPQVTAGSQVFQDGVHITHGDSISVIGGMIYSGDDSLAFGVDFSGNGGVETWDDEALTNVTVDGTVVNSAQATGIKVYYGRNTTTNQPFAGSLRGKIDGLILRGITGTGGVFSNGGIYVTDTTLQTFTGGLSNGATSGTLTAAYTGPTGTYYLIFDNGNVRSASFTNNSTSVTWTVALSSAAGATVQQVDPGRIKNVDIDANLTVGSLNNNGITSFGLFVQGATDLRVKGTLRIVDTAATTLTFTGSPVIGNTSATLNAPYSGITNSVAVTFSTSSEVRTVNLTNGSTAVTWTPALVSNAGTTATFNGFIFASINMLFGGEFSVNCPQMPRGAGMSFFNGKWAICHDQHLVGCGTSRGQYEQTGFNNLKLHDNFGTDLPTSGTFHIVQGLGSQDFLNSATRHHNTITKAAGATTTRAYIQQSNSVGAMTYLYVEGDDIRGQSNSTAIDQFWNTVTTPDIAIIKGVRGFSPNTDAAGYVTVTQAASQAVSLLNNNGGHFSLSAPLSINTVLQLPTGGFPGAKFSWTWTQDGTGTRTVGFAAGYKFYGGAPVSFGTAGQTLRLDFELDASLNPFCTSPGVWVT